MQQLADMPAVSDDTVNRDLRDGVKVDWSHMGLLEHMEAYLQGEGLVAIWDGRGHVLIDVNGMSQVDIRKAVVVATHHLMTAGDGHA